MVAQGLQIHAGQYGCQEWDRREVGHVTGDAFPTVKGLHVDRRLDDEERLVAVPMHAVMAA